MTKKWYEIKAMAADGKVAADAAEIARAEISIHDEIGAWGIMARDFIADFNKIPTSAPIDLSVHSVGGSCYEALAIYHVLARSKERIVARVEGVALSAASMIVMAAGKVEMPANAYMMIHNPLMATIGDHREMQSVADLLGKLKSSFAAIYCAKTGKSEADVIAMMDAETWMTGEEAVAEGFADTVIDAVEAVASLSESTQARFVKVPQALAPSPTPPAVPAADPAPGPTAMPADKIAAACAEAGLAALAAPLIRAESSPEAVTQRLAEAREIAALAQAAGRPADAELLVLAGVSVETARARLTAARAAELPPIDPTTSSDPARPDGEPTGARAALNARLNFSNIYSRRQAGAKA